MRTITGTFQCVGAVVLLLGIGQAAWGSEAYVEIYNCGYTVVSDPLAAVSGVIANDFCGSVAGNAYAAGSAIFSPSNLYGNGLFLDLSADPLRGVSGYAYLDDYLTFNVAGGGSAVVHATISGTFAGTGYPGNFSVSLGLGSFYQKYVGSVTDSIDGSPNTDLYFPQTGHPESVAGVVGNYTISYDWTIVDGGIYNVFTALNAGASGTRWASDGQWHSSSLYIDDPLIFTLPQGVSFTSESGSTYSVVPVPAAAWLFGSGLLWLVGIARHKKAA